MSRLLDIRFEEVYSGNHESFPACETFIRVVEDFILLAASKNKGSGRLQASVYRDEETEAISTLGMEVVFVMTTLLQQRKFLFQKE
jgi:hypothetical protein